MPKTNRKNSRRRTHHPVVTVVVILLLIGVSIFVSKMLANRATDDVESDKKDNTETTKVEKVEKVPTDTTTSSDETEQKTPIQNDGADPNTKDSLTGALTMAEVSGDTLRIRANIDQYLASGACTLNMYSDFNTAFSDSAAIIPLASNSTCEGFDIPVSNFASGHWHIVIDLTSGDKIGTVTGEINL
ncbi:hypothetical protein IJI94_03695 [Candidatus Saccharibacteria bacterium]|nr:hypothetical protein [Candidatus Saccharibacteria bacterium]